MQQWQTLELTCMQQGSCPSEPAAVNDMACTCCTAAELMGWEVVGHCSPAWRFWQALSAGQPRTGADLKQGADIQVDSDPCSGHGNRTPRQQGAPAQPEKKRLLPASTASSTPCCSANRGGSTSCARLQTCHHSMQQGCGLHRCGDHAQERFCTVSAAVACIPMGLDRAAAAALSREAGGGCVVCES